MPLIPGRPYSLKIDFPLSRRILVSCSIVDEAGRTVQSWEKPIDAETWSQYGHFARIAENFLSNLFKSSVF